MARVRRAWGAFVSELGDSAGALRARVQVCHPGFVLDVDLSLPGRGVTVLFGPSGCGKTTLLRALAGLDPCEGEIALGDDIWQGPSVFRPVHQRPLGYVFQDAGLFPHLTVRDNLLYGWKRVAPAQRRVTLDEALSLMGIEHLLKRRPERLSGGERQRVAIARALLTSPRLLLMDEPLSALDAPRKAEVLPYLERLNRDAGVPMVYVTHASDEAARLADHLVFMRDGRVLRENRLDVRSEGGTQDGAVLEGVVHAHDHTYGQTQIDVGGQHWWVGQVDAPVGRRVRVLVLARDVSVSLSRATDSSILNIVQARVNGFRTEGPDAVMLQLALVGGQRSAPVHLLARITRRSFDALGLTPGVQVYAQIKGVALMR